MKNETTDDRVLLIFNSNLPNMVIWDASPTAIAVVLFYFVNDIKKLVELNV